MIRRNIFTAAIAAQDERLRTIPHYDFVCRTVARFKRKLPAHIEFDDLFQVASIALLRAVRDFDGRGTFEGFAALRMQRAMIDEVVMKAPIAGGARARRRRGAGFDVQIVDVHDEEHDVAPGKKRRVLDLLTTHDGRPDVILRQRLAAAFRALPTRERYILVRSYIHEERFEDIAPALNVNPSRVSQLHLQAIKRLRRSLEVA